MHIFRRFTLSLVFLVTYEIGSAAPRKLSIKQLKPNTTTAQNQFDRQLKEQYTTRTDRSEPATGEYSHGICQRPNGLLHEVGDFSSYSDCEARGGTIQVGQPRENILYLSQ